MTTTQICQIPIFGNDSQGFEGTMQPLPQVPPLV
jgi:hypothetical protein